MIQYIIPQNPDDRVLADALKILNNDGVIVFPTDTNWVMAVKFDSKKGVERLYQLKSEAKTHHFSLLCLNLSMATDAAVVTDHAFRYMRGLIPGAYTFILEAQNKTKKLLKASKSDRQVGLRFPPVKFAQILLERLEVPLVSTNLTPKMLGLEEDFVPYGQMIDEQFGHAVDMIVDPGEYEFSGKSTIVSLLDDQVEILRMGAGPIP